MGTIKRTPADDAFSKCVRERANWTCENCGTYYPEGHRKGLDCSHFFSRGNWSVRFDPANAFAHCVKCHFDLGGSPSDFHQWFIDKCGQGAWDLLNERRNDVWLGKQYKKTKGKGEVAKHYREEFKLMQECRAAGELGKIEFEAWL